MSLIVRSAALSLLSAVLALPFTVSASSDISPEESLADSLTIGGQSLPVEDVHKAPIEGLFEVRLESGETFYTTDEGRYLLVGDLFENTDEGMINLTEQKRNDARAQRLADVGDDQRVIFRGIDEPKAKVTIFTDTTCPYCTKLHEEVPQLNEMGIQVDYLAFPRGGMQSQGAREMQQIWCADNTSEAMSVIQRGDTLDGDASCDNPVEEQYHLGIELGVSGTPAIVLPNGQMVPGYIPAERLAGMLQLDAD
ncbi:DsbC family protein [Halomonas halocynthiae]|uniref:DsbC family protein n=1 Tax=Halomonas halocynthiae TaxID=176290 RepID=UPI00041E3DAC|nr:DsbC family protein [Halomonas halocynthiae]